MARRSLSKALGAGLLQIEAPVDDFAVLGHCVLQSFGGGKKSTSIGTSCGRPFDSSGRPATLVLLRTSLERLPPTDGFRHPLFFHESGPPRGCSCSARGTGSFIPTMGGP